MHQASLPHVWKGLCSRFASLWTKCFRDTRDLFKEEERVFGYSVNIVLVYCVRVQPPVTKPRSKKWMAKTEASNFLECILLSYLQVFCQDWKYKNLYLNWRNWEEAIWLVDQWHPQDWMSHFHCSSSLWHECMGRKLLIFPRLLKTSFCHKGWKAEIRTRLLFFFFFIFLPLYSPPKNLKLLQK